MAKILFVNGNLHGHINPTLPIVRELIQRGEEVYYFSTMDFKAKLEATGAVFMDYSEVLTPFMQQFRPHGNHPFYTLMEYMLSFDRIVIPYIISKTKDLHFDYMIYDVMFGGGNILSKKMNLPAIASCSSFVMEKPPVPDRMLEPGFHPQLDYLYSELKTAQEEWNLDSLNLSDIFFKKEAMTLVYTSRFFQPLGDSLDPSFQFVGPSITDRKETLDFSLNSGQKLIYISMGTINNNCLDFYQKCLNAFQDECYQVVMSIGNKTEISELQNIPKNFIVKNYIPQLEVLKRADVFISHGGLNSVSEALYFGVPVIAIPMANDQPVVAKRLAELGAGLNLNMTEVTTEILNHMVHTVLTDPSYRLQSREIGNTFVESGGYKKASDLIINYKKSLPV